MHTNLIAIISIIIGLALISFCVSNRWLKLTFRILSLTVILFLWFLSTIKIGKPYYVQDKDGQFQFVLAPNKGRDMETMYMQLEAHKRKNGIVQDVKLYRTMKKNYLDPSMWLDYQRNRYWELEFIKRE